MQSRLDLSFHRLTASERLKKQIAALFYPLFFFPLQKTENDVHKKGLRSHNKEEMEKRNRGEVEGILDSYTSELNNKMREREN